MTTTECQRTTGWRQRATNIRHPPRHDGGQLLLPGPLYEPRYGPPQQYRPPRPPMIYLGAPCFITRTLTFGVVCI